VLDKWGAEGAPSLVRDGEQFKKVLRGLNGGEAANLVMLAYLNLHGLVPQVMPYAAWAPLPPDLFDAAKMPTAAQLQPFLSGIAMGLRRDAKGVTLDVFSPTGVVTPAIGIGIHEAREEHERTMRMLAAMQPDAPFLGLTYGLTGNGGFVVLRLVDNGPAAKAGLRPQDVIMTLADRRVGSTDDLRKVLLEHHPGAKLKVKVQRSGEEMELELTLGRRGDFEDR
jgi:membrane-associated protease RseP (regulator of RpoE activity)